MKLPTLESIDTELARKSLAEFTQQSWHVLNPTRPLEWNWHLDAISQHVEALLTGTLGKQNLLITVSPRSLKSSIVSVAAPAWMWLRKPEWCSVFASGNEAVAMRDSMKCRELLDSNWYRGTFRPKWRFKKDQNAKGHYENNFHGSRRAIAAGAFITGLDGDSLFVDDPLDAADAYSEAVLKQRRIWWDDSFGNRLKELRTGTRCIIMQRLTTRDLAGHVLAQDPQAWEHLDIPMEWNEKRRKVTSLGWTDPRTEEGEVMFPLRYTPAVLRSEKLRLGERGYNGQYQQLPVALEGEIFRRGYVRFVCPTQIPPATIRQRLLSADTAVKTGEENDYSVLLEGWEFDHGVLLRSCLREKLRYTALKEASRLKGEQVKPSAFLIEDKQSGQQVIQELQDYTSLPIVPIQVNKDKTARGWPLVPYWEAGRVFFPCDEEGTPEEWVADFLEEIYLFPKTRDGHDDRYDAMVQLLTYLVLAPGARGLSDYYAMLKAKEEAETAEERKLDALHHPVERVLLGGAK